MIVSFQSQAQTFSIEKTESPTGKRLTIVVRKDTSVSAFWASCYFGELPIMSDSEKLSLIEALISTFDDTSLCGKPVEALSYRYNGRYNSPPISTRYNLQIEALILINYIALSSEAIVYSPFPVIFDKKNKREITTFGDELDEVIKCYKIWYKALKKNNFKEFKLPLVHSRYEWFGSLYTTQRTFAQPPKWKSFYNCPLLNNDGN